MKTPEGIKRGLENCTRLGGCVSCPYFVDNTMAQCTPVLAADAIAYIQQLEAKIPKWISVKERLPDEGGEYIVLVQLPNGTKDRRWDVFHPDAGWCEDCDAKVLFWMSFYSLPDAPKEETK